VFPKSRGNINALNLLKDWSVTVIAVDTGLLTALGVALISDVVKSEKELLTVGVYLLALSLLVTLFVLGALPLIAERLRERGDASPSIYLHRNWLGFPIWLMAFIGHSALLAAVAILGWFLVCLGSLNHSHHNFGGLMYELDSDLVTAIAAVVAPFITAILGYMFFNRQEKIKSCQQRYLNEGLDVLTNNIETILRTFMHNWSTALNALRVFNQLGPHVEMNEYRAKFQYPTVDFQIKANDKLKVLVGNLNFYKVHQELLALQIRSIDFFSADLMTGLISFSKSEDNIRAEVMAKYLSHLEQYKREADSYYKLLDFLYELTRILEKSHYDFETVEEFPNNYEVRVAIKKLEQTYPQAINK